jgi:hypothetical protein
MMRVNDNKVLTVGEVVDTQRNYFKDKRKSIRIIRVFFNELLKVLCDGQQVRFPGKRNGKIYLAVKHINLNGIKQGEFVNSKKKISFLKGIVKPISYGFDVTSAGRVKSDKEFTLRFSYPERTISKLQKHFAEDIKRRKLPEIQ